MNVFMYVGLLVGLLLGILGISFRLADFGQGNLSLALVFVGFTVSVPFVLVFLIDQTGSGAESSASSREDSTNSRRTGA